MLTDKQKWKVYIEFRQALNLAINDAANKANLAGEQISECCDVRDDMLTVARAWLDKDKGKK